MSDPYREPDKDATIAALRKRVEELEREAGVWVERPLTAAAWAARVVRLVATVSFLGFTAWGITDAIAGNWVDAVWVWMVALSSLQLRMTTHGMDKRVRLPKPVTPPPASAVEGGRAFMRRHRKTFERLADGEDE